MLFEPFDHFLGHERCSGDQLAPVLRRGCDFRHQNVEITLDAGEKLV